MPPKILNLEFTSIIILASSYLFQPCCSVIQIYSLLVRYASRSLRWTTQPPNSHFKLLLYLFNDPQGLIIAISCKSTLLLAYGLHTFLLYLHVLCHSCSLPFHESTLADRAIDLSVLGPLHCCCLRCHQYYHEYTGLATRVLYPPLYDPRQRLVSLAVCYANHMISFHCRLPNPSASASEPQNRLLSSPWAYSCIPASSSISSYIARTFSIRVAVELSREEFIK